ncbi:unnamed protein product [Phytophthora lilii]|uniref:Unnamed protein product n=1 Tax=Phytophthora lilii TaxID=2077276 RepID=A0A9W6WW11_9STRA|nr:unnamed protein product [Phytophthora lilii]
MQTTFQVQIDEQKSSTHCFSTCWLPIDAAHLRAAQPPPPQVVGLGNDVEIEKRYTALTLAGRLDGDPCEVHEDDDVSIGRLLQLSPKRYLAFAITGSRRRMSVDQVIERQLPSYPDVALPSMPWFASGGLVAKPM